MKGTRTAYRYAKSLLDLAIELNKLDEIYKDMSIVSETVSGNKELELLLKSPIVKEDQKETVLLKIFDDHVCDLTKKFIRIITRKRRERYLGLIADSFIDQYMLHNNIVKAQIISASPLDEEIKKKVSTLIKEAENSTVDMEEKVDPELIGGLIVRVKDKQIDASIARKIRDLKQEFSKNPYIADF